MVSYCARVEARSFVLTINPANPTLNTARPAGSDAGVLEDGGDASALIEYRFAVGIAAEFS